MRGRARARGPGAPIEPSDEIGGRASSLYQLTIEPDTISNGVAVGQAGHAGRGSRPRLVRREQEIAEAAGLPAYKVSNHARPGAESRHNLIYWRYGEYAGVGPGAHGQLLTPEGRRAQATEKHPEMWLAQVESEGHGLIENAPLSVEEQGDEFLLMGLRLREGVDRARFEALRGRPLEQRQIDDLRAEGFIEEDETGRIRVTHAGMPLLDLIVADLAA